jgi:hypothetical protein
VAAERVTLSTAGPTARVARRVCGMATRRATFATLPTVEDPDPVARPANESTSLAVAFKVVLTESRS